MKDDELDALVKQVCDELQRRARAAKRREKGLDPTSQEGAARHLATRNWRSAAKALAGHISSARLHERWAKRDKGSDERTNRHQARNKRLPQTTYLDLAEDAPEQWLQQVFENGEARPGVTGLWFGIEGVPGVIINAAQARAMGTMLLQVADHLDEASEG